MFLIELFTSPLEYEYDAEGSEEGEEMYWKFSTEDGQDYVVLIQHVLYLPVDVWSVEFTNMTAPGSGHQKTGTGGELPVFATVMDVLKKFSAKNGGVYMFSSDDPGRSKLYARIASRFVTPPNVMVQDDHGKDSHFYVGTQEDIASVKETLDELHGNY